MERIRFPPWLMHNDSSINTSSIKDASNDILGQHPVFGLKARSYFHVENQSREMALFGSEINDFRLKYHRKILFSANDIQIVWQY